jgi:hypothetical protein
MAVEAFAGKRGVADMVAPCLAPGWRRYHMRDIRELYGKKQKISFFLNFSLTGSEI